MSKPEQGKEPFARERSPLYWKMHDAADDCPDLGEPRVSPFSERTDFEEFASKSLRRFFRAQMFGRVDAIPRLEGVGWPTPDLPDGTVIQFGKEKLDFKKDEYSGGEFWGVLATDPNTNDTLLMFQKVDALQGARWTVARNPKITVGAVMHTKMGDGQNEAERITGLITYGIRPSRGLMRRLLPDITPQQSQLRPVRIRP